MTKRNNTISSAPQQPSQSPAHAHPDRDFVLELDAMLKKELGDNASQPRSGPVPSASVYAAGPVEQAPSPASAARTAETSALKPAPEESASDDPRMTPHPTAPQESEAPPAKEKRGFFARFSRRGAQKQAAAASDEAVSSSAAPAPVKEASLPEPIPGRSTPSPEADYEDELQWSDDKLFSAIDAILNRSIFEEEVPQAEASASPVPKELQPVSQGTELPEAEPAEEVPEAGAQASQVSVQAEAPQVSAQVSLPVSPALEQAVPAVDPQPDREPQPEAALPPADHPEAVPAQEAVPASSSVEEAAGARQQDIPAPEAAGESVSTTALPSADTVPAHKPRPRRRFGNWLSELLHSVEEDDWDTPVPPKQDPAPPALAEDKTDSPVPLQPAAREEAPEKGKPEDKSSRETGPALHLEDLMAAAVPMEEAAPVVRPTRPAFRPAARPSEDADSRGAGKTDNAALITPHAAPAGSTPGAQPVPSAAVKAPEKPEAPAKGTPAADTPAHRPASPERRRAESDLLQGLDPSAFLTHHPARKNNRPRPKSPHAWMEEEVRVPGRVPDSISTAPEDTVGLTPAAPEEKPAAPQSKPFTHPETGLAWEGPDILTDPVPSAAVRPEPKRPQPRPAAQRKLDTLREAIREDPELQGPAEKPAVLHPEEAYRKYTKPIGAIGSNIVITGFFAVLALFLTLYLSLHWHFLPEIFSGGFTAYLLLALLLGMVITDRALYTQAARELLQGRFSLDTLILFATVFTALDTVGAARALRAPFGVVIGALLMLSLWGKYQQGMALAVTTKVLKEKDISTGVVEVKDITKGRCGITRTKPDIDAFMEKLETRDALSKAMSVYAMAAGIFALLATLLVSIGLKREFFLTGALIFIGSVPLSGLLAFGRLFFLLSLRLSDAKAALCGYYGAEVFGGDHSILIGDDDLFPEGSLALNGFKVYQGNPDRIIAYATAATRRSGSALFPLFDQLLDTHNGRHYTVDSFRFYDSGGIGATIVGDVVLLGSLDFMRRMGIHMDGGTKVRQAVYVSVNGELAAVFAVKYTPPESIRKGLAAIAGNRHFKGILVTRTFLGTPSFLKARFGVPAGALTYPPTKERLRLSEEKMKSSGNQGAVLVKNSFVGFAQAAAGGRVLRSATSLATVLSIVGGIVSLLLMTVLAALSDHSTATAVNLLFYVLAWLIPTMLLSSWTRHY